jgi:hypothetical protein
MVEYLNGLHSRSPKVEPATQILVIVDHFTKIAHLILLKDDAKPSKDLAKIFVSKI